MARCGASGPGSDGGTPFDLSLLYVELAQKAMARTGHTVKKEATPHADLEDELLLLSEALTRAGGQGGITSSEAVLAEYWEEVDEALVASLAQSPLPAPDSRLPPIGPIVGRAEADAEAREALAALMADPSVPWTRPWPVEQNYPEGQQDVLEEPQESAPKPREHTPGVDSSVRVPVDTRVRSTAEPSRQGGGPILPARKVEPADLEKASEPNTGRAPATNSFRTASELLPPSAQVSRGHDNGGGSSSGGAPPTDFDAVSRSIVGRNGKSAQQPSSGTGGKEGAREWTEDWLRIADPEQLERIVPALEATIHKMAPGQPGVQRHDIAGLRFVKTQIDEVLILPRLHPQLFASALTRPSRGLLLFGPPGTGKTMIARWIASECGATFFNISASSVMSKWIGEAEKTVKALFQLAVDRQPSVIFVDEIDSLLSKRRDADNESSRRVKNEFLTSLEGAETDAMEKILLVGATNMPWEIDPAAMRRLPKRLYVPLPSTKARSLLLSRQLSKHNKASGLSGAMGSEDLSKVVASTEGFSGSDLQVLLQEAAMGPVRDARAAVSLRRSRSGLSSGKPSSMVAASPRDICLRDFEAALVRVRPSFMADQEALHRNFNEEYGTCRGDDAMCDLGDDSGDESDVNGDG